MKAYPTDVHTLSDAELKTLSEELSDAYLRTIEDGDGFWTDEEGEERYNELVGEIHRREWDALTPEEREERARCARELAGIVMEALANNLTMSRLVSHDFDRQFSGKIGHTITVRRPPGFRG